MCIPFMSTPQDTTQSESELKRQQTGKVVGTNISPARVRRHIDKLNLNAVIDKLIAENKEPLTAYKNAKNNLDTGKVSVTVTTEVDGKKVTTEELRDITPDEVLLYKSIVSLHEPSLQLYTDRINALSSQRTRFSNEASIALAVICEEFVAQLSEHAILATINHKKKIMQINYLHAQGVEKLSLYALYKDLPSFAETAKELSEANLKLLYDERLNAALVQAEKDFRKKYNVKLIKKKAEENNEPAPTEPNDLADEEESVESKTSFKFYVGQVCKDVVKRNPAYSTIRVSTDIRDYLSKLVVEFIQRIAPLILLATLSMKNKTISAASILHTVKLLLVNGHTMVDTVEYKTDLVPDPAYKDKLDRNKVPKIPGLVAVRSITHPTSGYNEVEAQVSAKLKIYEQLAAKKPENELFDLLE